VGSLVDGKPAKRTKLDDLRQFGVDLCEAIESLIERQDRHLVGRGYVLGFVDGHAAQTVSPFARAPPAGVIDQDPAHHPRRDAEKVGSILPIDLPLIDEPDEDLMNKGRRL
jgi:hypothetical protein